MLKMTTEKVYVLSYTTNLTDKLSGSGLLSHRQSKQSETSGFALYNLFKKYALICIFKRMKRGGRAA